MEIKVRAWNKIWKCMHYLTGFKITGKNHIQLYYLDSDGDSVTCTVFLENIILEQYTGLPDKNGVEICQGDILKVDNGCEMVARVIYLNYSWMIQPGGRGGTDIHLSDYESADYEVVGSIHDDMKEPR